MATDTPNQHLIPKLEAEGRNLTLTVQAIPKPGASPLCLGIVNYIGAIANLEEGPYRVIIMHREETMLNVKVEIGR